MPIGPQCSDASSFAYGTTTSSIQPHVAREFWRFRDRRGHYTKMANKGVEYFMAIGPEALRAEVEATLEPVDTITPSLELRFDFVEVCCGLKYPLTRAMAARGFVCGPCIDRACHPYWVIHPLRDFFCRSPAHFPFGAYFLWSSR